MDENKLAFSMGYAFSHAIHVQTLLAPKELLVPYVIYWEDEVVNPIAYPASTQHEAVRLANEARQHLSPAVTGWAFGREGAVLQQNGTSLEALLIEGWTPGVTPPLQMLAYFRKDPFRLLRGFFWQPHPTARKNAQAFMANFQQGIEGHTFGAQCFGMIQNSEPVTFA
jgi:hypothetical protein